QEEWKFSILSLHYFPTIESHLSRQILLDKAAQGFAKVVELELKTRVFAPFRDHVRKQQRLIAAVSDGLLHDNREPLYQYLNGKERLMLGEMAAAMAHCQDAKEPILREFTQWLQRTHPALLKQGRLLATIA